MYTIIIILVFGLLVGFFIRRKKKIIRFSDKLLMISIYLLLFLLGISIGKNSDIIGNFPRIGLKAIALTVGGILGSCVVSLFIYKFFFVVKNEK